MKTDHKTENLKLYENGSNPSQKHIKYKIK